MNWKGLALKPLRDSSMKKWLKRVGTPVALAGLLAVSALSVSGCGAAGNASENATGNAAEVVTGGRPAADAQSAGAVSSGKTKEEETKAGETAVGETAAAGAQFAEGQSSDGGMKRNQELVGIPIDTHKAEAVSIYYGSICYSYFSEDQVDIKKVADLFTGFSLEEVPDGQLDPATTYQVYFSTDTEQTAAINVDKKGMFYLPEEKKFYKVKNGAFHFEKLDQIYKDSMNADGFDENQCLIK